MILEAESLQKSYTMGEGKVDALKGVNLTLEKGTLTIITGPSGSGKTTLLNLLGLLDRPDRGEVTLNNQKTTILSEKGRQQLRLHSIGFIFQLFNLIPTLTVIENIEFPLALAKKPQPEQKQRALELAGKVGLQDRLGHRPKQLSAGQMQRVSIARALANHPQLLLADEPTGELDQETGTKVMQFLKQLTHDEELTVLMVTHNPDLESYADNLLNLVDGRLTQQLER